MGEQVLYVIHGYDDYGYLVHRYEVKSFKVVKTYIVVTHLDDSKERFPRCDTALTASAAFKIADERNTKALAKLQEKVKDVQDKMIFLSTHKVKVHRVEPIPPLTDEDLEKML